MNIHLFSDIHFDIDDEPHYPATTDVLPELWKLLERGRSDIDLAVLCGDLTVRGPAEISELIAFRERIDSTGIPYMAIPGNHDLAPSREFAARYPGLEDYEEKPLGRTNFARVFGEEGLRRIIEAGPFDLIGFAIRDDDPDDQLSWLERVLKRPGPKLVFGHYPLVPAREGGFCAVWEYKRIGRIIPRLKALIAEPAHRVRAYFCGHIHINSRRTMGDGPVGDGAMRGGGGSTDKAGSAIQKGGGAIQVVNGATGLATVCYKRIVLGENGTARVSTKRLPGFDGLYGKIMNPDRSTDRSHPDRESYHWGNDEERDFVIGTGG